MISTSAVNIVYKLWGELHFQFFDIYVGVELIICYGYSEFNFFFFFVFLGMHLRHMEVPRLGVESEQ